MAIIVALALGVAALLAFARLEDKPALPRPGADDQWTRWPAIRDPAPTNWRPGAVPEDADTSTEVCGDGHEPE